MQDLLARLRDVQFVRYILASVGALAVDMACFLLLLATGTSAVVASAAGYSAGIAAHWLMSSRAVFSEHVARNGTSRSWQKMLFVLSAFVGLGITTLLVGGGELVGIDPRFAKLVAIGSSFIATWLIRSRIVFRKASAT